MGDSQAPAPDAVPVQQAAAAVATPATPATPATKPAEPAAAPVATPDAKEDPVFSMETPVDYENAAGKQVHTTMGDMIGAHDKVAGIKDIDQVADVVGALNNEPEATKRILEAQLKALEPAAAEVPGAEILTAMQDKITQLETQVGRSDRLVRTVEAQEFNQHVGQIVTNDKVKEAFPELTANPQVGALIAGRHLNQAQKAAGAAFGNRELLAALQSANAEAKFLTENLSLSPNAAAANATAATQAVAGNGAPAPGVVQGPQVTVAQLLDRRNPAQPTANPAPLPQNVPPAGGLPGNSAPLATPDPNRLFSVADLKARAVAQLAQSEVG